MNNSPQNKPDGPRWLLAELTYKCPMQCPYCSNPVDFAKYSNEISTEDWKRVLSEGRKLGAVQLGFSGGEPLLRKDLEELVEHARKLGFYSNLITAGVGADASRIGKLKEAGLDHVQVSFDGADAEMNDKVCGMKSFDQKIAMAKAVKAAGYPMVLNFVLHKQNIESIGAMLQLALDLGADQVELANTQYYGWAYKNKDQLMPSKKQLEDAERTTVQFRKKAGKMRILFVVPDYFETRPKACMAGWGQFFLTIAPDGVALPCHAARELPGLDFPSVQDMSLEDIWYQSEAFQAYRGEDWMPEPCRSCDQRKNDFGGCRCQAFRMTGDARNADPVCDKSSYHHLIEEAIRPKLGDIRTIVARNSRNSKKLHA